LAGSKEPQKNNSHVEPFLLTSERKRRVVSLFDKLEGTALLSDSEILRNISKERSLVCDEKNAGVAIVIAISSSRQRI
jgi:hypothetical protein